MQTLERDLQSRRRENADLQQQLQSSEREREAVRQQLTRKEAELTRAEETIRREQQQIQQLVSLLLLLHVVCVVTRGHPDCIIIHVTHSSGQCVCLHNAFFTTSGGYQS